MDFGGFKRPSAAMAPTDPIEIFGRTPNLDDAPNDLWAGQSSALKEWHKYRSAPDVLISLNTGAGKSIVGLLIAQSLINEKRKVLYVCSTNDLIFQTEREARKLGLKYTTRHSGAFSNDAYDTEKAFCITNYSTVFSVFSPFRNNLVPDAIIFDDAHVAEKSVRDSVTLTINRKEHAELFSTLISSLTPSFDLIGRKLSLVQTLEDRSSAPLMAPCFAASDAETQIFSACFGYFKAKKDNSALPQVIALKEMIRYCCIMISHSRIEISPPFVPTNSFSVLRSLDTRRIYLSATLKSKADMIRTFGRQPIKIIEPANDAGNGERLIVFHKYLPQSLSGESLAKDLAKRTKVLIAVPSSFAAQKFDEFSVTPTRATFSSELDKFRDATTGAFTLVYRVDGIDLPHRTCRIMLIEGLPTGSSLLEKYQFTELNMRNMFNGRIANRLIQLFGRINRGRSDYGVFIIVGRDINNWLDTDRFISLMPDVIQRQLMLSKNAVEQRVPQNMSDINALVDAVLERNETWLEYYRDWSGAEVDVSERDRATALEEGLTKIATAEVAFANALLEANLPAAMGALTSVSEAATTVDAKIAGWHDLWLGHCASINGDASEAQEYFNRAKSRLSPRLPVKHQTPTFKLDQTDDATFLIQAHLVTILGLGVRACNDQIAKIKAQCKVIKDEDSSSRQSEEAVRALGSLMGFRATRPDNEYGRGPDVLWEDAISKTLIPIELKTDKKTPAIYRKKDDVGQAHDSMQWLKNEYTDYNVPAFIFLGPYGRCSEDAHPGESMYLCSSERMIGLATSFCAILDDLKLKIPLEQSAGVRAMHDRSEWKSEGMSRQLQEFPMKSLKKDSVE